jgi:hypothetical protein
MSTSRRTLRGSLWCFWILGEVLIRFTLKLTQIAHRLSLTLRRSLKLVRNQSGSGIRRSTRLYKSATTRFEKRFALIRILQIPLNSLKIRLSN